MKEKTLFQSFLRKIVQLSPCGTKRKAINRRLPAPANAAKIMPKLVGKVLDAKNIANTPPSMVKKTREYIQDL
ncbi:hypothetical protein [Prochlorococcus sp. MIT 1223]|uniref:hypothetical protein n=1 Tax=Prochlorococcus sp. MIT 1223 TaxID=3096217 RepID=UPI002A75AF40|nr:hypothetical protein [Prochlorococcus sp. MIT 1223]